MKSASRWSHYTAVTAVSVVPVILHAVTPRQKDVSNIDVKRVILLFLLWENEIIDVRYYSSNSSCR
jgi:hypothetical protein